MNDNQLIRAALIAYAAQLRRDQKLRKFAGDGFKEYRRELRDLARRAERLANSLMMGDL